MFADPSAAERAYQRLKNDILTGALATGPLDIRGLGDQLKMSVTPVREALARLSAERLVKLAPHHGYAVANPSAGRLRNLYELAGALVDLTIERCSTSGLASEFITRGDYAQDITSLVCSLATAQPNRELGEHLLALSDRLFPARRCEPTLFPEASSELDRLVTLWTRQDLAELRRRFYRHHAARMGKAEFIASLLTEAIDDQ